MRKQYHFRKSKIGFYAWDVDKLIQKSKNLPVVNILISDIVEFRDNYWYQAPTDVPTCESVTEHVKLIMRCNLDFPIILCSDGGVMDGMHRVCKAYLENRPTIEAVKFASTPPPDFEDVFPDQLTY